MQLGEAVSISKVKIRLTGERWLHIITSHKEVDPSDYTLILEVIENPDFVLKGNVDKELLAVKKPSRRKYWFVIVYKETSTKVGFVITAYITSDIRWLLRRKIIWSKKS